MRQEYGRLRWIKHFRWSYILMKQKIVSTLFFLTSIVIGLGAFGHASQWWKHVYPAIGGRITDSGMIHLLFAVWLFVSGCMLSFGLLLLWAWRRIRMGDRSLAFIPTVIGLFYVTTGVMSWIWVGRFFALFVVLGGLLLICTLAWNGDKART